MSTKGPDRRNADSGNRRDAISFSSQSQRRTGARRPCLAACCFLAFGHFGAGVFAGDLAFSDPANLPPPPAHAVGFPSRDPNLDALPGFQKPPAGYGEVPFFWWLGDPLTKERLAWELDQFAGVPVAGMQINYAHSDRGGRSYGLTFPSEPPLFSEPWWELFRWFMAEGQQRGMAASLSDYTLAPPGQGWWTDEIIKENPTICGSVLKSAIKEVAAGKELVWSVPENPLSVVAFRLKDGAVAPGGAIDLHEKISGRELRWLPADGSWRVVAVSRQAAPLSLDPLNPLSGKKYVEKFFQRFEDRCPGQSGKGLNFFFSDELDLGVRGKMWSDRFADEFQKRKGYDLLPELAALFTDIGPRTPKVRLDYSDVLVSLSEENFFRPLFDWHYSRGMVFGCDHGGRGRDVVEFGDYFRTQRWMTGPGNDQPRLSSDVVKTKVASSISHLYQRPRAWLEGYYGSGWGTTTADVTDATFRNFVLGHNLLTLHGLYYSLHGGYWEWAPPCNHFRMPYWPHMGEFLRCAERLSYLLSQGVHRCDVAVLYPVAPMEADLGGKEAVQAAFDAGPRLFNQAIDFDFMDFESLARAGIKDRKLCVSGEEYRVLILPAMKAVRYSTMQKALQFFRSGGTVIAIGALPEASDRVGRNDAELEAMTKEIFSVAAKDVGTARDLPPNKNKSGGTGTLVADAKSAVDFISRTTPPDFSVCDEQSGSKPAQVLHRKIGPRDVFMVLGVAKGAECYFRANGRVENWDPWTGEARPLHVLRPDAAGSYVRMPLESNEAQIVVFTPGEPEVAIEKTDLADVTGVERSGDRMTVSGFATIGGRVGAQVRVGGKLISLRGDAPQPLAPLAVDGPWEFELKPTLDNRWGDFRLPASDTLIGPEARRFRFEVESRPGERWELPNLDDSKWAETTCGFGQQFWKLGPLPENADTSGLEAQLAAMKQAYPTTVVELGGKQYRWQPYDFSWRWGVEGDPGHEGYHGLKEQVSDEFIALGKRQFTATGSTYQKEEGGSRYYLWTSVVSFHGENARVLVGGMKPAAAWLNGAPLDLNAPTVRLGYGGDPLLLRYDSPGRGYVVFQSTNAPNATTNYPLAMRWYRMPGVLSFNARSILFNYAGWYRFVAPPGLQEMRFKVCVRPPDLQAMQKLLPPRTVRAWANNVEMHVAQGEEREDGSLDCLATAHSLNDGPVLVALRIEQPISSYGGTAIPEPIALKCGAGKIVLGDWSRSGALADYSGGAWYRKTVTLPAERVGGRVMLNLGSVAASAEVHVNGQLAGIKVAPPWTVDISKQVKAGENRIEVLVYNTLANQYATIPTRYRGQLTSGLLGPVTIETAAPVVLKMAGP